MNRDETIIYYQRRAPEYDQIYFWEDPARQSELADLYFLSRRVLQGRQVLDLACGTGFWTKIISERAGSITGVDINRATLARAAGKKYLCPVRLVRSDFFHLPFAGADFDGLLATFVISHVRRQDLTRLRDMLGRVMKPGAAAFLCDNNPVGVHVPSLIWDSEGINSYRRRRLQNREEYQILKNYYDRGELAAVFSGWGKIERLTVGEYYWSAVLTMA